MKYSLLSTTLLFLLSSALTACHSTDVEGEAATQRSQTLTTNLRNRLVNVPNGWHLIYFPMVDSTLNSDVTANIKTSSDAITLPKLAQRMGVGGYNAFIKFRSDGTMSILTDIATQPDGKDNTAQLNESYYQTTYRTTPEEARYEVQLAEELTLAITTATQWNHLYYATEKASQRFSPMDDDGNRIVLRTANYLEKGNEVAILTPLTFPETEWEDSMRVLVERKERFRRRSFDVGQRKEGRICVLRIAVKESGETVWQSTSEYGYNLMDDRVTRHFNHNNLMGRRVALYDRRQYELFYRNEQPDRTIPGLDNSQYYTALGAGYVATHWGIRFVPGLRWNEEVNFTHFRELPGKEWQAESGPYTATITFVDPE